MSNYRVYLASTRETTQPRTDAFSEVEAASWIDAV